MATGSRPLRDADIGEGLQSALDEFNRLSLGLPEDGDEEIRVSTMQITINTNRAGRTAAETEQLVMGFKYMMEQLFTRESLNSIIPVREGGRILRVKIYSPAIEIGPRFRRVHSHFVMRVTTVGGIDLSRMGPNLSAWCREFVVYSHNFYVNVRLLDGRADNYILKSTTRTYRR